MRNFNYCLLLLLITLFGCSKDAKLSTPAPDSKVKVFDFHMSSVKETKDGGFILGTSVGLVKLNAAGEVQWKKNYSQYNTDTVNFAHTTESRVFQNLDGGYTILVSGILKKLDLFYYCLIKTDGGGNKTAVIPYYFSSIQFVASNNCYIIENSDKGYVISFDSNDGKNRVLFKTDIDGKIIWLKKDFAIFGTTGINKGEIFDMMNLPNNEFAVSGYCLGFKYTFFGKYSYSGNIITEKKYAMGGHDGLGGFVSSTGTKMGLTNSSNLLIFGIADRGNLSKTNFEYSLIKINANGDSLTSAIMGTSKQDYCNYGMQTSDNGFALIGSSTSVQYDDISVPMFKPTLYFLKLDQNLNFQNSFNFGENMDLQGFYFKENSNKSFTLIGTKYGYNNFGKPQTIFIITTPAGGL